MSTASIDQNNLTNSTQNSVLSVFEAFASFLGGAFDELKAGAKEKVLDYLIGRLADANEKLDFTIDNIDQLPPKEVDKLYDNISPLFENFDTFKKALDDGVTGSESDKEADFIKLAKRFAEKFDALVDKMEDLIEDEEVKQNFMHSSQTWQEQEGD